MNRWLNRLRLVRLALAGDERGLSTAELLGNAALAIAALIVIWAALETLGVDVVSWIRGQILGGSAGT
ncbi:MAG TPA: hypothetical protein VIA81_03215 [Acidimicrobiia bacterium]